MSRRQDITVLHYIRMYAMKEKKQKKNEICFFEIITVSYRKTKQVWHLSNTHQRDKFGTLLEFGGKSIL